MVAISPDLDETPEDVVEAVCVHTDEEVAIVEPPPAIAGRNHQSPSTLQYHPLTLIPTLNKRQSHCLDLHLHLMSSFLPKLTLNYLLRTHYPSTTPFTCGTV